MEMTQRITYGANLPRELGNRLVFWYTADSLLPMAEGAAINVLSDISGNNFHMVASGSARPTFRNGVQNGLPAMRFDGSNCAMVMESDNDCMDSLLENTSLTFFAVVNGNVNTNFSGGLFCKMSLTQGGPNFMFRKLADNDYRIDLYMDNAAKNSSTETCGDVNIFNAPTIATFGFTQGHAPNTPPTNVIYTNNTLNSNNTSVSLPGIFDGNSVTAGIGWVFSPTGGLKFAGDIFELGCFVGTLTEPNRVLLTNYLSAKWGISIA